MSRQTRWVTLRLTQRQAQLLSLAAGNTLEYSDATEAVFTNRNDRQGARQAYHLLNQAAFGGLEQEEDDPMRNSPFRGD